MKKQVLAKFIDQTNLKPGQTEQYITEFCKEADEAGFASVCILPTLVETATSVLKNTNTKVCTVISFPLGMDVPEVKICATKEAIEKGAEEIDLVLNVCALKSGLYNIVNQELFGVSQLCHDNGVLLKLIIETPLLNEEQIIKACELAEANQVDIVKTSTGFSAMLPRSTSVEDVKLIRKHIKPTTGLKAAGGIRITADALKMIEAGATRIGASSGKEIVAGLDE
ncbi:deoxyribose-phosphate aldolase [Paratissierella segnis]|jgi:deoxyribose-phosphate aldolase|uniref:Deoxyribose-phosphate aldolase n=1 Tax=Paratissierella segnis TaxID=2763679 RepID=A0A926EWS3_9FIRM|nr:deoxyribose-phosphate aldolase [Paratissierella segnis]MBC8588962.1 deoxyribose-phosphate aldolase [Paratissierella segnis]